MMQQIQHKGRLDSPFMKDHHYSSSSSPAFGKSNSSSHQTRLQHPSYSSNAFADMVGSFSVPQSTQQMRSPWYSPPPAPQRFAPSSRRAATFTARSPPSPSNSSYTTTSSNTSSFSSQPGQSAAIGATHRPLATWTHGSNIWRKRLIDYCQDHSLPQPLYHTFSDKRGGRTAWSCGIVIGSSIDIKARLWFDGAYIENAAEDAAELAWKHLQALESRQG